MLFLFVDDSDHFGFGSLDLGADESFEDSLFDLSWGKDSAIWSGDRSLSVAQCSIPGVAKSLQTAELGIGWSLWLDSLGDLANVFDCQSASRGSVLSDLIGRGVVRLSSQICDSVGCHALYKYFLLFFRF